MNVPEYLGRKLKVIIPPEIFLNIHNMVKATSNRLTNETGDKSP